MCRTSRQCNTSLKKKKWTGRKGFMAIVPEHGHRQTFSRDFISVAGHALRSECSVCSTSSGSAACDSSAPSGARQTRPRWLSWSSGSCSRWALQEWAQASVLLNDSYECLTLPSSILFLSGDMWSLKWPWLSERVVRCHRGVWQQKNVAAWCFALTFPFKALFPQETDHGQELGDLLQVHDCGVVQVYDGHGLFVIGRYCLIPS